MSSEALFDPSSFRRLIHSAGASALLWYFVPESDPWGWGKRALLVLLFFALLLLEALRLSGRISWEGFFGLRSYERNRPAGYAYFALSTTVLLLFVPEPLAVPLLLGMSLGDPLAGEVRDRLRRGGSWVPFLVVGALGSLLFVLSGWSPEISLLSGGLLSLGESIKHPLFDDDLLMPLLPGALLLGGISLGLVTLPPPPLSGGSL